jgi:putative ATP-dependent endonuclease of the OLD family
MQLESLEIENFRSIEHVRLPSLGRLNVLIGKNNSGKSNTLSAVEAFFSFFALQAVATADLPFGKRRDFFRQEVARKKIRITGCLQLTAKEQETFWNRLAQDFTEMKISPPDAQPKLWVTIEIVPTSPPICFLQSISVRDAQADATAVRRPLFEISATGAHAVHQAKISRDEIQRKSRQARQLKAALDEATWSTAYATLPKDNGGLALWLSKQLGEQPDTELLPLVRHDSYADVDSAITAYVVGLDSQTRRGFRISDVMLNGTTKGTAIPQFVQSLIWDVGKLVHHSFRDSRPEIGPEDADHLLSLSTSRDGRDRFTRLQRTVADLIGADLEVFRGQTSAELDVGRYLVDMNGSGIREALRLVLDIELKQPKVVLIEEPELHLHPSLQTTMRHYLNEIGAECQVFLTTHSTYFVDPGDIRNVYLVSHSDSTELQLLDREEAESQLPRELGLRLSSLFMHDRLIFVEGDSDENVLQQWADELGLHMGHANVGFIPMGGARNMSYFAAESTLNFLAKRQIQMWFVIDHDERNSSEVADLRSRLGGRAHVHVLQKRELENYLICPRALAEFITRKRLSGGVADAEAPSEQAVTIAIQEAAEALRDLTIMKRLLHTMKPLYTRQDESDGENMVVRMSRALEKQIEELQSRKEAIAATCREQEAAITADWHAEKLSIVPGDELLDAVCRKFGVRFRKEADSLRLAALMTKEEIDPEIAKLLRSVVETTGN